jgi:hypothetical protein
MATWQQVKSYIYNKYEVSNDSGDMMTLNFGTGNGRSQMVMVAHIDAGDLSSVNFSSPFASWSTATAERVLRASEQVLVGISSTGDYFITTHSQLLSSIDENEIDWPMIWVTSRADALEQALGLGDAF